MNVFNGSGCIVLTGRVDTFDHIAVLPADPGRDGKVYTHDRTIAGMEP